MTRKFVDAIHDMVGPDSDIPAPDMGTNAQVMAWFMSQYQKYKGFNPACVTGKPLELHGSEGREEATGRGVATLTAAMLERVKQPIAGGHRRHPGVRQRRLVLPAQFLHAKGMKVVAVSDKDGGIFNPQGLDIPALLQFSRDHASVRDFPAASRLRMKNY